MSDRLNELQHQRALLQEHLAWIEREIAAEMTRRGPTPPPVDPPPGSAGPAPIQWPSPVRPAAPVPTPSPTGGGRDAESILQQYQNESRNVQQDVRKGCFLYFILAFALLGLAVAGLYFHTFRRH